MLKNLDFLKTGVNGLTSFKLVVFKKAIDMKLLKKLDPTFEKLANFFWSGKFNALVEQSEALLAKPAARDTARLFKAFVYTQFYDRRVKGYDPKKMEKEEILTQVKRWLKEYEDNIENKIGYYTLLSCFYLILLDAFNKDKEKLNYLVYFQQKFQNNLDWIDLEIQEKLDYLKKKWYLALPYKSEAIGEPEGELFETAEA